MFDIYKSIPQLDEILDVFKYMTPLMREKIVEYLSYYWLTIAQESLGKNNTEFERWVFATLYNLQTVFNWLKLQQPKQEQS